MRRILTLLVTLGFSILLEAQDGDTTARKRRNFAIFPAIASSPETGLQLGAVLAKTWLPKRDEQAEDVDSAFVRPSSMTPVFLYTLKNQIITQFSLDLFTPKGNNYRLSTGFIIFPDRYFGIGNDNDVDIFEVYTNQSVLMLGQALFPLNPKPSGASVLIFSKLT